MKEATGRANMAIASSRLLLWRVPFVAFLAAASASEHYLTDNPGDPTSLMVGVALLVCSLGLAWLGTISRWPERLLTVGQLTGDVVLITLLIELTGGGQSLLPLCYCLPILWAAFYISSRLAMTLAGMAAIFTGGGQVGYALGWWWTGASGGGDVAMGHSVVVMGIHISLFLVVGVFSGRMADRMRLRQRLQGQASAQIQRAKQEVRDILDHLNSGILVVDRSGIITRVNPAAERILGLPRGLILGQSVGPALGGDVAAMKECIAEALDDGVTIERRELSIIRKGREVPVGVSVNRMEREGDASRGVIAIFRDMTEIIRMREKIREKDRLAGVGELSARIAHEIRNPLASIRGSVEILAGELDLEGHNERLFELILRESGRVNTIINDFLAFSRLRPAVREPMNCTVFMTDMELQIKQHCLAKGNGVSLSFDVEPEDLELTCDSEQMRQVVLNLAINACEAMNDRGSLEVKMALSDTGEYCVLTVTDSGPGVAALERDRFFKPFVTTKRDGTGLGLPMVTRIVGAHAGVVEAENGALGGAEFRVTIPLAYKPLDEGTRFALAETKAASEAAERDEAEVLL